MSRASRTVIAGVAHHVTQRGNNQETVFFDDDDRLAYLELLRAQSRKAKLRLLAWCLMANHVHLVAVPERAASLARAVGRTHFRYTQYVNARHGRSGHLWQGRFYSCPLDQAHAWQAVRYVELNPVRAKLVRAPWRYPWSSAAAHVTGPDSYALLDLPAWRRQATPAEWKMALRGGLDDQEEQVLRRCTRTGRPLGTARFVTRLEKLVGHRLRALPTGRPRGSGAKG